MFSICFAQLWSFYLLPKPNATMQKRIAHSTVQAGSPRNKSGLRAFDRVGAKEPALFSFHYSFLPGVLGPVTRMVSRILVGDRGP